MAYIGTEPKDVRSFGKAKFDFTATQGQTAFTGADDDGKTLGFTDGQINVYVNGILMDDSDYSTSGNNTVTLSSATNLNDIISVVALQTDIPNSDYVPATGGTFAGDVSFTGSFTSQGIDDNATSTAMTLDSSGNLLVGKTSTSLGVDGALISPDGSLFVTKNNSRPVIFNRRTSDGNIVDFQKDGAPVGSIGVEGGDVTIGKAGSGLQFRSSDPCVRPHNMTTNSPSDATVNLGRVNTRFKDLYLSGGVYLGGTGGANHLDDYEEGAWTPTLLATATDPTVTYDTTHTGGKYIKIGKMVWFTYEVRTSAVSGGSGNIRIGGLPFTRSDTYPDGDRGALDLYRVAFPSGIDYALNTIPKGQVYMSLLGITNNGTHTDFSISNWSTSGTTIARATGCYHTDA